MTQHTYRYLTRGSLSSDSDAFTSRLAQELSKAQKKAPPAQWHAFIKGLTTKGVKGAEIEELKILEWLDGQASLGVASISRTELLAQLSKLTPIIKEVILSRPLWGSWRHQGSNERKYEEALYILNSEKECYDDRLAEIRFEIEELDFDLERLAADPDLVLRLYEEQQDLIRRSKIAEGHKYSHFSNVIDPDTGNPVVNLIAHARTSIFDDVLFVQEIQSDWAQSGRRQNWKKIPKGPFVTNTELWAGLVLRRLIQKASQDPTIKRFAWILGGMRNGGRQVRKDKLDDFYLKIMPKIADRALSGTGVKTSFTKVLLGDKEFEVPGFEITDKVREKFRQTQPLYSLDLLPNDVPMTLERKSAFDQAIKEAKEMLGSSVSIRLASKVLDAATGQEVAGYHLGPIIEASLKARNPALVIPHEAWHYAHENLLGPFDQETVDRAFANGSYLNNKVRMALVRDGASSETVAQCDDAREAAAHGFALWTQGKMEITPESELKAEYRGKRLVDRTVGRIFKKVEEAYLSLARWVKRKVGETQASKDVRHVEIIFEALRSGVYAKLEAPTEQERAVEHDEIPKVIRPRQRA